MPRRATSLSNISDLAIAREIDSKYDAVKAVSLKLNEIELITEMDIDGLISQLNEALDFTGIIVVAGAEASWNPTTKVLTVPTLQGIQGIQGETGLNGVDGTDGADGTDGLTPEVEFSVDVHGNLQYEITYV